MDESKVSKEGRAGSLPHASLLSCSPELRERLQPSPHRCEGWSRICQAGRGQDCCISATMNRLPDSILMADLVKSPSLGRTLPCLFAYHTISLTILQGSPSMSAFTARLYSLKTRRVFFLLLFFNPHFPKMCLVQSRCSVNLRCINKQIQHQGWTRWLENTSKPEIICFDDS